MQTNNNGFTPEEAERFNRYVITRSNTTLPGEEVPPSVRAKMSPEALEIERSQNLSFEQQVAAMKAAQIATDRGISMDQVTAGMIDGSEHRPREEVTDDVRIKQDAAAREAKSTVPTAPAVSTTAPNTPPAPPADTAKTTFGKA